jgi:hypothetical protein
VGGMGRQRCGCRHGSPEVSSTLCQAENKKSMLMYLIAIP